MRTMYDETPQITLFFPEYETVTIITYVLYTCIIGRKDKASTLDLRYIKSKVNSEVSLIHFTFTSLHYSSQSILHTFAL